MCRCDLRCVGRFFVVSVIRLKKHRKTPGQQVLGCCGVLRGIRTPDLLVRSQTLYPAELAAHIWRRAGDSNPRYRFLPVYSLSRRAPSTDSANSPCLTSSGLKGNGGEGGIRTHDTLLCDGFQDRSVVTTSVPLHGNALVLCNDYYIRIALGCQYVWGYFFKKIMGEVWPPPISVKFSVCTF